MVHTAAAVIRASSRFYLCPVSAAVLAIQQTLSCPRCSQNRLAYQGVNSGQGILIHNQGFSGGIAFSVVSSWPPSFEAQLYCR